MAGGAGAGASRPYEVHQLQDRGRGLVATRDVDGGEVLGLYEPLVTAVAPAWRKHVCARCMKSTYPRRMPMSCEECRAVAYCSAGCQGAHRHGAEACHSHKRLLELITERDEEAAWTSLAALLVASVMADLTPELWSSIWQLCQVELPSLDDELRADIGHAAVLAVSCLSEKAAHAALAIGGGSGLSSVHDMAVDVLTRAECNAFSYWDADHEQLGQGLFLEPAMFNHSCAPNAGRRTEGRRLCVRAIQRVRAGEELCISYVPLTCGREERRGVLRKHFGFECACARCGGVDELPPQAHECGGVWMTEPQRGLRACSICRAEEQL